VVPPPGSAYGAPVQPSTGWQPPYWIRSSSCRPLSNSWLPTEEKSTFMRLLITIAGSSWNSALASGEAPMASPAITVASFRPYSRCRSATSLAR
jgi:hypothetical protein